MRPRSLHLADTGRAGDPESSQTCSRWDEAEEADGGESREEEKPGLVLGGRFPSSKKEPVYHASLCWKLFKVQRIQNVVIILQHMDS